MELNKTDNWTPVKIDICDYCAAFRSLNEFGRCQHCKSIKSEKVIYHNELGYETIEIMRSLRDSHALTWGDGTILTPVQFSTLVGSVYEFYEVHTPREINRFNNLVKESKIDIDNDDDVPVHKDGFVYLGALETGIHKVGETVDIAARMEALKKQYAPIEFKLLHFYPASDCIAEEARIRKDFAQYRLTHTKQRDFFKLPGDVVEEFCRRDTGSDGVL